MNDDAALNSAAMSSGPFSGAGVKGTLDGMGDETDPVYALDLTSPSSSDALSFWATPWNNATATDSARVCFSSRPRTHTKLSAS